MKRLLKVIPLLIFTMLLSACSKSPTKPISEVPANSISSEDSGQSVDKNSEPVSIQDIKLVKKASKAKYLLTNGIKINYDNRSIKTVKGDISIMLPQIQGLADKALEQKLNRTIEKDVEAEVKNYISEYDGEMLFAECAVDMNANNLLSISVRGFYTPPVYGFLYRLTDGERIYLKDIFTKGTDYVSLLNRRITEGILSGESSDEYILKEPFKTIDPNQSFALSSSTLYIIFHKGEGGFAQRNSVAIPLSTVDDYVDVIDSYTGTERKTQLKTNAFIESNNIFATYKGEVYKRDNGNLWIHYPEISGLGNPEFEKKINAVIKNGINELKDSNLFNNLPKGTEYGRDCTAVIELNATFNHYGILSVERNVFTFTAVNIFEEMHKVYSFDLNKAKQIDAKTIVDSYLSKNKDLQEAFTTAVREQLEQQCISRKIKINNLPDYNIDYSYIKEKGLFYFTKYFDEDELLIHVSFNGSTSNGTILRADCTVPLKSIVPGAPAEFFK